SLSLSHSLSLSLPLILSLSLKSQIRGSHCVCVCVCVCRGGLQGHLYATLAHIPACLGTLGPTSPLSFFFFSLFFYLFSSIPLFLSLSHLRSLLSLSLSLSPSISFPL